MTELTRNKLQDLNKGQRRHQHHKHLFKPSGHKGKHRNPYQKYNYRIKKETIHHNNPLLSSARDEICPCRS